MQNNTATVATVATSKKVKRTAIGPMDHEGLKVLFHDHNLKFQIPENKCQVIERKDKDGNATGVTARKFDWHVTQGQAESGHGFSAVNSQGEVETVTKVTVLMETRTPEQLRAKADAKIFRNLSAELRRRTGLNKGTKAKPVVVKPADVVTLDQLVSWKDGGAKISGIGYDWKALPKETVEKLEKVIAELMASTEPKTAKKVVTRDQEKSKTLHRLTVENPGLEFEKVEELLNAHMKQWDEARAKEKAAKKAE